MICDFFWKRGVRAARPPLLKMCSPGDCRSRNTIPTARSGLGAEISMREEQAHMCVYQGLVITYGYHIHVRKKLMHVFWDVWDVVPCGLWWKRVLGSSLFSPQNTNFLPAAQPWGVQSQGPAPQLEWRCRVRGAARRVNRHRPGPSEFRANLKANVHWVVHLISEVRTIL